MATTPKTGTVSIPKKQLYRRQIGVGFAVKPVKRALRWFLFVLFSSFGEKLESSIVLFTFDGCVCVAECVLQNQNIVAHDMEN